MKTSELTGAALDWAVAKCEGRSEPEVVNNFHVAWYTWGNTHYSTNWAQGGPIIEREMLKVYALYESPILWAAQLSNPSWKNESVFCMHGPTPLIAAMRCYVASKLGDDVDVPEGLK